MSPIKKKPNPSTEFRRLTKKIYFISCYPKICEYSHLDILYNI